MVRKTKKEPELSPAQRRRLKKEQEKQARAQQKTDSVCVIQGILKGILELDFVAFSFCLCDSGHVNSLGRHARNYVAGALPRAAKVSPDPCLPTLFRWKVVESTQAPSKDKINVGWRSRSRQTDDPERPRRERSQPPPHGWNPFAPFFALDVRRRRR